MTPAKKPGFVLPTLKLSSSQRGGLHAQVQGAGSSEASTARVIKNTPALRKLDEILKRPIP